MASDRTVEEFKLLLGDENSNEVKMTEEEKFTIMAKANESLTAQLADVNVKLDNKERELADTKAKLAKADKKIASMEESCATVERHLHEVTVRRSILQSELSDLQGKTERQAAAMTLELKEGETKIVQLETDLRDTKEQLAQTKEELEDRKEDYDYEAKGFLAEAIKSDVEVDDLKRSNEQLNTNLQTANDRNGVLTTENRTLTERLTVAGVVAQARDGRIAHLEALQAIHERTIAAARSILDRMRNIAPPQ